MKFHIDFDLEKPDEERALMILEDWQRRSGLLPQKVIVMALLALGPDLAYTTPDHDLGVVEDLRDMMLDMQDQSSDVLGEVRHLMDRVQDLLEQGLPVHANGDREPQFEIEAEPVPEEVPDAFVASLKKNVKRGFSLDG